MAILTRPAVDGSTYIVTIAFYDEDDMAVVPNTVEWRLSVPGGEVIHDWTVVAPQQTIDIVLTGGDLYYEDGAKRILTVQATYDSPAGLNLPLNDEAVFQVVNLRGIRR